MVLARLERPHIVVGPYGTMARGSTAEFASPAAPNATTGEGRVDDAPHPRRERDAKLTRWVIGCGRPIQGVGPMWTLESPGRKGLG